MTQPVLSSVFLIVAAIAYLVCGIGILRTLKSSGSQAPTWLRALGLGAFVMHAAGVLTEMFGGTLVYFGFGTAVSAIMCIAVGICLVESMVHRINGLMGLVITVSSVCAVLPVLFRGAPYPVEEWAVLFRIHLLVALAAYSFMTIAVVQAVLLTKMERSVVDPATLNTGGILSNMPSLLAMERILFRIIGCGFVCLTLVLILGSMATRELHGTYFMFDHRTVLTWLSWLVFACLLTGRRVFGWRKKKALAWFWTGTAFLAMAYLIYRFVLDAFC